MARLATIGFESQVVSTTANYDGEADVGGVTSSITGTPTIDTANQRSGAACLAVPQGSPNYAEISGAITTLGRAYFARAYFKFSDASPGTAAQIFQYRANAIVVGYARLNTNGTVALFDTSGQIGSASATLSDNTWYRLDLKIIIPSSSTGTLELYLDGTLVATSTTAVVNNSITTASVRVGNGTGGTGGITTYIDDVALNDDQGSAQNSRPGSGKIVTLWPASHSSIGTWVGPQTTGDDTTNLEQNVDNRPPLGTSLAAGYDVDANAGKFVFNITNSADQDFDLNTETYTAAGIPSGSVINVVQGFVRGSVDSTTGTNTLGVEVTSNPAISIDTANNLEATAVAGTEPTGWKTFKTAPSHAPSVTLGSAAVIRGRKIDASTRVTGIDQMGVIVDYTPVTVVTASAAIAATAAISSTGTSTADGGPSAHKLAISALNTAGYTTRTITLAEAELTTQSHLMVELNDATDYIIDAPYPIHRSVHIIGGRNIVWRGGRIELSHRGYFPAGELGRGIWLQHGTTFPTRTIILEGIRIHGEEVNDGINFDIAGAELHLGNILIQNIRARSSTAFSDGPPGGASREYQGVGHWHADAVQPNEDFGRLVIDRMTIETSESGVRFTKNTDEPSIVQRLNVRSFTAPWNEETPLGTSSQTWTTITNRASFEASQNGFTSAVGGATLTYPYTTTPLGGSQSLQVSKTASSPERLGAGCDFASTTDWSDGGTADALSCLFRLDDGGGHYPMARIDVSTNPLANMSLDNHWHLGQSHPVPLGETTRLICKFPTSILATLERVRVVLITDQVTDTHSFVIDNIASGTGETVPTFDGPTGLAESGKWGLTHVDKTTSENDASEVRVGEVYGEVHPDNLWKSNRDGTGNGQNYNIRSYDWATATYDTTDQPPGDAEFQDYWLPSPPVVGSGYVEYSATIGPKLKNLSGLSPARMLEGPPPSGDFVTEDIAGVNYSPLGYFGEESRGAAVGATAAISASGVVVSGGPETFARSASLTAAARITTRIETPAIPIEVALVREPEVMTVSLDVLGGQSWRFGPDKEDAGDVPLEISYSSQSPGGFADSGVVPSRPPWVQAVDAPLFAEFSILGRGNAVRWKGRVKGTPQVDATTIRIEGEGLAAALTDNEFFQWLGVHNELSAWRGPSVTSQAYWDAAGYKIQANMSVDPDTSGYPAVTTALTDTWDRATVCEGWLETGGIPIGQITYSWSTSIPNGDSDGEYDWGVILYSDDDAASAYDFSGNLRGLGPGGGVVAATDTRKFANVYLIYNVAWGTEVDLTAVWWSGLSVFGQHGLSPRELPEGNWGLLDQDIIGAVASSAAIPVNPSRIQGAGFIVPHSVQTAGTIQQVIEEVTAYGGSGGLLNDWGVDEQGFYWLPPNWGPVWRVRRDQTAEPIREGPTTETQCTGVVVTYNDPVGAERSVGPPGSGADYEAAELSDYSPRNVAMRLPNGKTRVVEGGLTNLTGAINIGAAWLREMNAEQRSQKITVIGEIQDEAGAWHDASEVRAGHRIVVADEPGVGPPEVMPIVSASYDSSETLSVDAGTAQPTIEGLIARLAARTVGG